VQHDYKPKEKFKMDGQQQTLYPRKNWSSFVVFNCAHPSNKKPFAIHYTRGGPWFEEWQHVEFAKEWINERDLYIKNKFN
jgi:hypothetical protein